MKKLIALVVVMLLPLGVFAQGKVALVYTQEIMVTMPEVKEMEKQLKELSETYRKQLQQMEEEFNRKYADFIEQQETLVENIKLQKMQDLDDIRTRTENLVQSAQEHMMKQEQELIAPIQDKLRNAIKAVGDEKGYSHILDPQVLLYVGNDVVDATPFVKAKLGL